MKFKFLGDTKNMKVFGYDFSDGATPDVIDEFAIAKLMGNAEFEAVVESIPTPPAKDEKAKTDKKEEKPKEDKPAAENGENGKLPGVDA
jgi:hypothetical protein